MFVSLNARILQRASAIPKMGKSQDMFEADGALDLGTDLILTSFWPLGPQALRIG